MVSKIISGGQTGADKGGLLAARELLIPTGGTAPKGWRTERGADITLESFGLQQSTMPDYDVRTRRNAENSDLTVVFNNKNTPGTKCTVKACVKLHKPYLVVDPNNELAPEMLKTLIKRTFETLKRPVVLNVAGSRESKLPGIERKTIEILKKVFEEPWLAQDFGPRGTTEENQSNQ